MNEAIRDHYRRHADAIRAAGKNQYGIDPYAWDSLVSMTPIEWPMWQDIRSIGMVMYPQYPVGRFFVDFGNPVAKVAIECDGAAWHQDKAADKRRQDKIESMGWTVYRFTGRQCRQIPHDDGKGQTIDKLREIAQWHRICS